MSQLLGGLIFVVQVIGNLALNLFKFPATKIKVLFVWERGRTQPKEEKDTIPGNTISWNKKKEDLPKLDPLSPFNNNPFKKGREQ